MPLVVPTNMGEVLMLQYIVGMVNASNPAMHLYLADVTPANSTVLADLSPCTSSGYAGITLFSTNWTTSISGSVTTALFSERTFTFNTNAIAYGYYVTSTSPSVALLWVERFSGTPFQIPDGGGTISISARLTLN